MGAAADSLGCIELGCIELGCIELGCIGSCAEPGGGGMRARLGVEVAATADAVAVDAVEAVANVVE